MNYYTLNYGINAKLSTVEDDIEALNVSNGTLEDDVESLITSVGTLNTAVGVLSGRVASLTDASTRTFTDTELLDQALTVSGGATPALTMTDINTIGANLIAVQVHNKGDATTVTINIFGKMGGLEYTNIPEATTVTLNATTTENDIIILANPPYDALKVVIANTDAANTTTIDAVVRVFKPAA